MHTLQVKICVTRTKKKTTNHQTQINRDNSQGLKTVPFSTNSFDIFNDQGKRKQPMRLQAIERYLEYLKAAYLLQEL